MTIYLKFRVYFGNNGSNYDTIVRQVKRNDAGDFNLVWAPGKRGRESLRSFVYRMTNAEKQASEIYAKDNELALANGLYEVAAFSEDGKRDDVAAKVARRALQVAINDILANY